MANDIDRSAVAADAGVLKQHFDAPRNVGSLERAADVATGVVGNPYHGDVIQLQLRVNADGVITTTRFKAYGGVATIAAGSWVAAWLEGKSLAEAGGLHNTAIAAALALPPERIHCAVLAAAAVQAALTDYASKPTTATTVEPFAHF